MSNESIKDWKKGQFMDWIGNDFMKILTREEDMIKFNLDTFYDLSDYQVKRLLQHMNIAMFKKYDENYGELMHEKLLQLENSTPIQDDLEIYSDEDSLDANSNNDTPIKDCVHIFSFLIRILQNPQYNPTVVSWVNPKKLIFKIEQKEEIAKLWGNEKSRVKEMSYEKFARSIRFAREKGFFRNLRLKKDFHYAFGRKAIANSEELRNILFENNVLYL